MFTRLTQQGITFYKSDNIEAKHLFSTRCGGVSTLPHLLSLNVGENRGDREDNVIENTKRLLSLIDLSNTDMIKASQIHSNNVRIVGDKDKGRVFDDCDGFVTNCRKLALCVKVADCVPVLLYDSDAKVIGALHAGWRGASSGIVFNGIMQMKTLGAQEKNIKVAIGACIHNCCYEVGTDFVDEIEKKMGSAGKKYVRMDENSVYHADIVGMNLHYLSLCGIPPENISVCTECTCCNPELFFSHRYSKGKRGTMCAVIAL